MNFNSLEMLVAFDENKTLLKTSENLNISQPALTVSMKKLETSLNVNLFERSKNKLTLNDNGKYFVNLAKNLLKYRDEVLSSIRTYDKTHSIIKVGMSAIAPDLYYLPNIKKIHNVNIMSNIESESELIKKIKNKTYDFIFITNKVNIKNHICRKIFTESLYFFISNNHPFANKKTLSFKDMNGESMLMNREVGFWDNLVRENMPDSNFILQDNLDNLRILIDNSSISSFASNLTLAERTVPTRSAIKISDKSATVDFYIVYNEKTDKKLIKIFK